MPAPLFNWLDTRGAGVLLHPTCLPGDQGIGTLDAQVDRFLDFLEAAGIRYWQICPLGPTGYGDSPYQCFSAFAGNPYLIDLRDLVARGFLTAAQVAPLAELSLERVDFGAVYRLKWPLLRQAGERYRQQGAPDLGPESFADFKRRQAGWLESYAYFRALKDEQGGRSWMEWPMDLRDSVAAEQSPLRARLAAACEAHRFAQYVFFSQWARVRAAAARRGISIIGDLPIFVAGDSADVWSHPELFELDPVTREPRAVAGVPPDYFSADGQLWGNPLYRWDRHAATGYAWWQERLRAAFGLCDVVRIDHFRGFEAYWRVPLPATTARTGTWTRGPGLDLFRALQRALPGAKIIAEDLGLITAPVVQLREAAGLPGMAVLQFAFGSGADNAYLPHNLEPHSVVYPGTHDNDTSLGWYGTLDPGTRDEVRRYLRVSGREIGWDFIRCAYESVSRLAIIPLQDILSLGSEGRFNQPGHPQDNWQWRFRAEALDAAFGPTSRYLREMGMLYGRTPVPGKTLTPPTR